MNQTGRKTVFNKTSLTVAFCKPFARWTSELRALKSKKIQLQTNTLAVVISSNFLSTPPQRLGCCVVTPPWLLHSRSHSSNASAIEVSYD